MEDKTINRGTIISSFIWKALEKIFSQGSNLIIQILLARLLLPADFGNLAIIVALVNYMSVIVQSGLSAAIIQKKNISQIDINTLFTISISVATFCYLSFFFLAPYIADYYHNQELLSPIRVTSLVLFLNSYNSIQVGILSRRMDFKVIFFRTAIAVPVSGIIGIYMAYSGFGLWALIVNYILSILLASIVMAIGTKTQVGFGFSWQSAKELYSFSIKILGASMICGFSDLFRTMAIGKKYTSAQLAYYDRAYNYSLVVLQLVTNSIQSVLLPVFSREQEDIIKMKELARKAIRITIFFTTPLLLGAAVMAKSLILIILTEKWLPCVPFFMLFCAFRWIGCVVGIDKQVILALGKSSITMYYETYLFIANLIMLLITIPINIRAIAIGALAVEYSGGLLIILLGRKLYQYSLRERVKDIFKPLLNSIIMVLTIILVGQIKMQIHILLLLQIFLGIFSYFLMAFLTKDSSFLYIKTIIQNRFLR